MILVTFNAWLRGSNMLTSLRRPKVHTAKIVTFVFGIHMYLKDCVLVHVEIVAEIKYVST